MPHEPRHPVKRIRQLSGAEKECIAGILMVRVVLVCMAKAAQKTWRNQYNSGEEPVVDDGPTLSSLPGPYLAGSERIKSGSLWFSALWEGIVSRGGRPGVARAGTFLLTDSGSGH